MERCTTRFLRGILVAALAAALAVLPGAASAQEGKGKGKGKGKAKAAETEPVDEAQAKARERYSKGKSLYEAGSYADAMVEFQTAYDLKPHPSVLKSIAECKVQIGDIPGAIAVFEKYLTFPEATKKEDIEAKIAELKQAMARLEISSVPQGASILLDGAATDKVTPTSVELTPGEHRVVLNVDGYQPLEKGVTLGKGESATLAFDFPAEGVSTAPSSATPLVDPFAADEDGASPANEKSIETETTGPPAAFWIAAAVAGVGLVSGTVFGTMALGDEKDFEDRRASGIGGNDPVLKDIKESGERNAIIADVSFGVTAAAAVVGTVMLIVHHKKNKNEAKADASSKARIGVAPLATGETFGVATAVTF